MRNVFHSALAVFLVGTLAGCAVTEKSLRDKGMTPLSQKQLEERYSRPVKIAFHSAGGVRGTGTYTPDGTARLDSSNFSDTGVWRIKDGKFCGKYTRIRNGQENCFTFYKTGAKEYMSFDADGS